MTRRIPCVGAIIRDEGGRIVVIRRGRPPSAGRWSLPGGRVEAGETLVDAVRREVLEETGLVVDVHESVGSVELPAATVGAVYAVTDFAATVAAGTSTRPVGGDDAVDARWVSRDELAALPVSPGLTEALETWQVWINSERSND